MKFISKMNRIDWVGNPGPVIRRGEEIEMDECDQTDTWLQMGYVSIKQPSVSLSESDSKHKPKPKPALDSKSNKIADAETGPVKTP